MDVKSLSRHCIARYRRAIIQCAALCVANAVDNRRRTSRGDNRRELGFLAYPRRVSASVRRAADRIPRADR